ncbi:hypothetical protein J635_2078 [Acinetobacter baumannii 233846]|nr:hypothetical protein J635_2078 [Acinetobacter baumannii 233846]
MNQAIALNVIFPIEDERPMDTIPTTIVEKINGAIIILINLRKISVKRLK